MEEIEILNKVFEGNYFELDLETFKKVFMSDLTLEIFTNYYKRFLFEEGLINRKESNYENLSKQDVEHYKIDYQDMLVDRKKQVEINKQKSPETIQEEAKGFYERFNNIIRPPGKKYIGWYYTLNEEYVIWEKDFDNLTYCLYPLLYLYLSDKYPNLKNIRYITKTICISDDDILGFMIRIFDD